MKANIIFLFSIIILASCSNNDNLSDAYGNFEVDDIIISAESNGKLVFFNVEEGKRTDKDVLVGIIDTTDLVLKQKQLYAQLAAVSSKVENIESQIKVQEQKKKNLPRSREAVWGRYFCRGIFVSILHLL